jgi:membrane-bound lytic murein transglycosylase MltF
MIVAGLIRQESTFQADIVSHANAVGLMQLLPKTAKIMARQKRIKYAKNKLFDPEYNIELGTYYFKGLVNLTGAPEFALAAYNAGEDRIALWKSERNYDEIPELVESIPFSETRDYVQIVLRNAALYRMIYARARQAAWRHRNVVEPLARQPPEYGAIWRAATAETNEHLESKIAEFRRMISAKAEQFTESVIREMTRLAMKHNAVNLS